MTGAILQFLEGIGLPVRTAAIEQATFLPGIRIESGSLIIDPGRLLYPGDILHEAGHLALMEPERRAGTSDDAGTDGGEEMGAIAWSYAAALHIRLDVRVLFHGEGYRGDADSIVENFANGRYLGVPMLEWTGLALDQRRARELGLPPYPHMLRWLRE